MTHGHVLPPGLELYGLSTRIQLTGGIASLCRQTFCSVETFEEVAKAVADCGFTTSDLPVILSLEVPARREA